MEEAAIREVVRSYILQEFLPGESPSAIDDSTQLISGGILDSIATVKLVTYLEDRYDVEFEAHEMSAEHLDTTTDIARIVASKLAA